MYLDRQSLMTLNEFVSPAERSLFIEFMPKIELHCHIEGTFEPELVMKLAERNKVALPEKYNTAEKLRAAYKFGNLDEFLELYYLNMSVLKTAKDFQDLTTAYLEKARKQHVMHTEIFFDPQAHTSRGIPFNEVHAGISAALDYYKMKHQMTSKLIFCILRDKPVESAMETLKEAIEYKSTIHGIGLDSSEANYPPALFEAVFAEAKKAGFKLVAHAGEEGPASFVNDAIEVLRVDRIDHGNRGLEDVNVIRKLRMLDMGMTVCPLSNLKLGGVKDLKDHTLDKMLKLGLRATVNSDDPSYFGGYMTENFNQIAEAKDLGIKDIVQLTKNAIDVSFMSEGFKEWRTNQLRDYVTAWNHGWRPAQSVYPNTSIEIPLRLPYSLRPA